VYSRHSADEGSVFDGYVSCDATGVCYCHVIMEVTIVSDVAVRHEHAVVTDYGCLAFNH